MSFYLLTALVLVLGVLKWEQLPLWIRGLVLLNVGLAAVLTTVRIGQRVRR